MNTFPHEQLDTQQRRAKARPGALTPRHLAPEGPESKPCERCSKPILRYGRSAHGWERARWCSNACRWGREPKAPKPVQAKACEECGVTIVRKRGWGSRDWDRRRWCSPECRRPQRPHESKECMSCGKTYYRGKTSPAAWAKRTMCSKECPQREADYRAEEALWLLEGGEWPARIAERLGTTCSALGSLLHRRGLEREARKFIILVEAGEAA